MRGITTITTGQAMFEKLADIDTATFRDGLHRAERAYDVLLVNPVRDGLNLVAKEGPVVNERGGSVVLSTEAGSHDELVARHGRYAQLHGTLS